MLTKDEIVPEYISTNVMTLNLLLSGKTQGGIVKGAMNMISANSSEGKSFVGLSLLKEAQKAGMECYVIDSEKAWNPIWARKLGINTDPKILPVIKTAQMVKIKQFISFICDGKTAAERRNVFVLFDSWGPLVSEVMLKKSVEASTTRDMSLPFWKNELANIMRESDLTFFIVNHVYDNTGGFGDPLKVPGGKRLYFNCDNVLLGTGKAKDKNGSGDITGAIMTMTTQKGRTAKEKSKLKYRIKHEGGLDMFYGILPDALDHGCVTKPKNGFYSRACVEDDKAHREKNIYCAEFWIPIFRDTDFEQFLNDKYTYSSTVEVGSYSLNEVMTGKVTLDEIDITDDIETDIVDEK